MPDIKNITPPDTSIIKIPLLGGFHPFYLRDVMEMINADEIMFCIITCMCLWGSIFSVIFLSQHLQSILVLIKYTYQITEMQKTPAAVENVIKYLIYNHGLYVIFQRSFFSLIPEINLVKGNKNLGDTVMKWSWPLNVHVVWYKKIYMHSIWILSY